MFKNTYLIRLDDASPYMDENKWQIMEDILDKYGVKPLVGIIPANADPETMMEPEDKCFWEKVHHWIEKGWEMALHGYDHVCISDDGKKGLNPVWRRSEFAGVPLEQQKDKIRKGLAILNENNVNPRYFFAPSHTYDENTLKALREESDIRIISDSYSLKPYIIEDFSFIPCQLGMPREMIVPGFFTICLHPNKMNDNHLKRLEEFVEDNHQYLLSFDEIDVSKLDRIRLIDQIAQWMYFTIKRWRQ